MNIRLLMIAGALILSTGLKGQTQKIGYIQLEKVFAQWPETLNANQELQQHELDLKKRLDAKEQEFNKKLSEVEENGPNMSELELQVAQTELQGYATQNSAVCHQRSTGTSKEEPGTIRASSKEI